MTDTYVECLVAQKAKPIMFFLKYLLISLTVVIGLGSLLFSIFLGFIIAICLGVAAYYVSANADIEFEYLYVDKQISIDKVFAKSRRKTVAKYDIDKLEILAPLNSHQLDNYNNRQAKVTDYSSGVISQPEKRYAFFYDGKEKIIFEPSEEFVKAIYNVAPRKVAQY